MSLSEEGARAIVTESLKYSDPYFAGFVKGLRIGRNWKRFLKGEQELILKMFELLNDGSSQSKSVSQRLIIAKCDEQMKRVLEKEEVVEIPSNPKV